MNCSFYLMKRTPTRRNNYIILYIIYYIILYILYIIVYYDWPLLGAINVGCQTPGKVLKNTKMPGRMGGLLRTTRSLQIIKVPIIDYIIINIILYYIILYY
jgi:hypothetical protein